MKSLSHVQLFATPWTGAYQSSQAMGFSRQEYWSGLPFNAKVGSQEIPGVTGKFGLGVHNEAGQRLTVFPKKHTGHSKHPLPATQETTLNIDVTRWSIPKSNWLYSLQPNMEKPYTVNKNKTGSWLWLRSWIPSCQIQNYIEESRENHWTIQVWPKLNPLWLYSGSEK